MPTLRTLTLRFPNIPLRPRQIPQFRGGVIESAGFDQDIFHNHPPEGGSLHRPALVQYRVSRGRAVLWGMGAGADALERWWLSAPETLRFDQREYPLQTAEVRRDNFRLDFADDWRYYRLHDYLALNAPNYRRWLDNPNLRFRAGLLESALTGHLLGFCQAAGWQLPQRLDLQVVDLHDRRKTRYHGAELMAFELTYRCNLLLPEGIALGKAVSHGFGVQWPAPAAFEQTAATRRATAETLENSLP